MNPLPPWWGLWNLISESCSKASKILLKDGGKLSVRLRLTEKARPSATSGSKIINFSRPALFIILSLTIKLSGDLGVVHKWSHAIFESYTESAALGRNESDNNNRMIQFTDVFRVLLTYNVASKFWLQYAVDSIIRDPIKRRTLNLLQMKNIVHGWYFFTEPGEW